MFRPGCKRECGRLSRWATSRGAPPIVGWRLNITNSNSVVSDVKIQRPHATEPWPRLLAALRIVDIELGRVIDPVIVSCQTLGDVATDERNSFVKKRRERRRIGDLRSSRDGIFDI
ncbi:hypothetical protein EVAR_45043_1 [Eumeta japonica]|uniref:Uncharacterized protein n=1 Tax=Eumeta variegata TaxID=151549 RepID=A0A4C1SA11_EUMVA|nr:hypothetical protein EVAR_45043_1 [Eumeta japonica]